MGEAYDMRCKKCGYHILGSFGTGWLFPSVYAETIRDAKNGELGEELQKFFLENPDGAIDVSNVVGMCKVCGEFENVRDLSTYLLKEEFFPIYIPSRRWSVVFPFEQAEYVVPWDLKNHYKLVAKYPHKCKRCGGELKLIDEVFFSMRAKCPKCHAEMVVEDIIDWD